MSLSRSTPLRRTGAPKRRTRLRPVSAQRADDRDRRAEVRAAVFARDRGCVLHAWQDVTGGCMGPLDPHHRRKASAGGAYSTANLVVLCRRHNQWVEDEPKVAKLLAPSLVVRSGDPEWTRLGQP